MLVVSCFIASPQDSNRTPHSSVTTGSRISKDVDTNPNIDTFNRPKQKFSGWARGGQRYFCQFVWFICPLTSSKVQRALMLVKSNDDAGWVASLPSEDKLS